MLGRVSSLWNLASAVLKDFPRDTSEKRALSHGDGGEKLVKGQPRFVCACACVYTSKWGHGSPMSWASFLPFSACYALLFSTQGQSLVRQTDGQTDRQTDGQHVCALMKNVDIWAAPGSSAVFNCHSLKMGSFLYGFEVYKGFLAYNFSTTFWIKRNISIYDDGDDCRRAERLWSIFYNRWTASRSKLCPRWGEQNVQISWSISTASW